MEKVQSFLLDTIPDIAVATYDNVTVLYLLYLRKYGGLKVGTSHSILHTIEESCELLGDTNSDVKLVYVEETEHAASIETSLKQCVVMNGWKRDAIIFNGSVQTEIIDLKKTTIQQVIDVIKLFVMENVEKITKRKQKALIESVEMEQKRLDIELESKRIELESKRIDAELESKRIDAELELKRIELELKRLDMQRFMIDSKRQRNNILNYYTKK